MRRRGGAPGARPNLRARLRFIGHAHIRQPVAEGVAREAEQARRLALVPPRALNKPGEFLFRESSLPEDASEERLRNILRVDGHGNAKLGFGCVQQSSVASGLVMDIEPSTEECVDNLLRLEDGQPVRHAPYTRVTATRSVAGEMSFGMGSPVFSALSR